MDKQVEYFIKIYTNEGIEEIVHKTFKSWNDDLNEMIANNYYFDDFGVRSTDVEIHGPDLCIDCNQKTFINRIPTERFNEDGDVIDDNVYRCQDCENKRDYLMEKYNDNII